MFQELFAHHVAEKFSRFSAILDQTPYENMVIASGQVRLQFQDDLAYPFKCYSYFKEWAPLTKRHGSYIQLSSAMERPKLLLLSVEDIWHTPPQDLPAGYEACFDIVEYGNNNELLEALGLNGERNLGGDSVFIGEGNPCQLDDSRCNPKELVTAIDYQRRFKTAYEQACIREANVRAAPAHKAAKEAFQSVKSELQICGAYLEACQAAESEMPYSVIAALNEHGAVLHHFMLDNQAPSEHRSLLIDAGYDFQGYASDITRTYAFDDGNEFAEMISAMDESQQQLVASGVVGSTNADLHILSHQKLAELLVRFKFVKATAETVFEAGITNTFYPHGIGHGLGANVHEKGGSLVNAKGDKEAPPKQFPVLRNTAPIVAGQVHTVEPGLYFIPALLDKLRGEDKAAMVNWEKVEQFIPYGGIRIEDNIVVHKDGRLENLTRDAFAGL